MQERDSLCKLDIAVKVHRFSAETAVNGAGLTCPPERGVIPRDQQPKGTVRQGASRVGGRGNRFASGMGMIMTNDLRPAGPCHLVRSQSAQFLLDERK